MILRKITRFRCDFGIGIICLPSICFLQTTPSENGTSNHIEHKSGETNGDTSPGSKTVEPKATVVEPEILTTPHVATIEPMETDQLSTPPEKVPEKTDTPAEDVTDSKPVEETAEKAVKEPTKSDEKESTEVLRLYSY